MIRSLRWRVQAWHAVVLTAVLMTFGVIVYHLLWQARWHQIDAELDRTAEVLSSRLRRLFYTPQWRDWHPPMEITEMEASVVSDSESAVGDREAAEVSTERGLQPWQQALVGPPPATVSEPRPGPWIPDEFVHLFEGEDSPLYYIVWDRAGRILQKSEFAPDTKFPNLLAEPSPFLVREARSRDWRREVVHVTSFGNHVLVGRSVQSDIANQHASGWLLAACGWVVLTIGVAGGGWLTGRAIRPIATMSATAKNISAENLSQRIDLKETDNELGQLAFVLNQTFDRLQAAFEQQSRFAADASHELRTPLAVIVSQTELALSKPRSIEEYCAALETCQRASRRMRSLIDSLLVLARFDSGQPKLSRQPLDLAEVASESVELLRPLAEERHITLGSEVSQIPFVGDREQLGQVVTNLIANAIRYNQDGGRVDVRVERVNGHAVVSVSDTGIGIPSDDLPHIFERFFRVDKARSRADGGSGLGLAICQSVVEAHGGKIAARSDPKCGTTLEVRLPLSDSPPENSRNS